MTKLRRCLNWVNQKSSHESVKLSSPCPREKMVIIVVTLAIRTLRYCEIKQTPMAMQSVRWGTGTAFPGAWSQSLASRHIVSLQNGALLESSIKYWSWETKLMAMWWLEAIIIYGTLKWTWFDHSTSEFLKSQTSTLLFGLTAHGVFLEPEQICHLSL